MKKVFSLLFIFTLLATLTLSLPAKAAAPDVINNYTVTVTPKTDGTLDMKYEFDYTATTDFPSDSVYLQIGVPNRHFSILDYGPKGFITSAENNEGSQSQVQLNFDHIPLANENFKFFFVINQQAMANVVEGVANFAFRPGWFDFAEIRNLNVIWTLPEDEAMIKNLDPAPTIKEKNIATWTATNLSANQSFTITNIAIDKAFYADLAEDAQSEGVPTAGSGDISPIAIFWIIVVVIVLLVIIVSAAEASGGGYGGGGFIGSILSGGGDGDGGLFGGGGGSFGGSGSSCVSSCACACACAGGGRAGCSQKGFGIKKWLEKRL